MSLISTKHKLNLLFIFYTCLENPCKKLQNLLNFQYLLQNQFFSEKC